MHFQSPQKSVLSVLQTLGSYYQAAYFAEKQTNLDNQNFNYYKTLHLRMKEAEEIHIKELMSARNDILRN